MLDESINQFKHSSNISLAFYLVEWCWMRFRAHPTCWTNILERKMSISIKFKRLNVRMLIQINGLFRQLFLSFYKMDSQSGETVEQTKETIKNGKKKWTHDEVQDLIEEKICLKTNRGCGIVFWKSTQRGRWNLVEKW